MKVPCENRIFVTTKGELDAFYAREGHNWGDPAWERRAWEIITRGLPPKESLACQYSKGCKNKVFRYIYNAAGEIHYCYCKKHWGDIMPHVRFFGGVQKPRRRAAG